MKKCLISYQTRNNEWIIVSAYSISPAWAAWKEGQYWWNITHVPTGARLAHTRRLKDAAMICKELDGVANWLIDYDAVGELLDNPNVFNLIDLYYRKGFMTRVK